MDIKLVSKNNPEFCEFYDSLVSALRKAIHFSVNCYPYDFIFTNLELCVIVSALQFSKDMFDRELEDEQE